MVRGKTTSWNQRSGCKLDLTQNYVFAKCTKRLHSEYLGRIAVLDFRQRVDSGQLVWMYGIKRGSLISKLKITFPNAALQHFSLRSISVKNLRRKPKSSSTAVSTLSWKIVNPHLISGLRETSGSNEAVHLKKTAPSTLNRITLPVRSSNRYTERFIFAFELCCIHREIQNASADN